MIIQCEACQTRFRLADEKVKPGGIKVRCSKCKNVFKVTPPEPEPIDETVDFGSFNMQKVIEETPAETTIPSESVHTDGSEPEERPEPDSTPLPDNSLPPDKEPQAEQTVAEQTDSEADFKITEEPDGALEFTFDEGPESDSGVAATTETDFTAEAPVEPSAFSFDEEDLQTQNEPAESDFSDESEGLLDSPVDTEEETPATSDEEGSEPGEFSFDEEDPFAEESTSEWDDPSGDDTSFDFEEPRLGDDDSPAESAASDPEGSGLQFGEIDFASDGDESKSSDSQTDDDFSQPTMELQDEPELSSPGPPGAPHPSHDYDEEPHPSAAPAKKSSLSRILRLLVLLLVVLGGAAGFLFTQEGSLNLNTVARYLPFLQDYVGEDPANAQEDRIDIDIAGSSYVTGQAGKMLIIQGAAVNHHRTIRSAITVKGILLDAGGQPLLQQTVFCGNQLDDATLQSMSFTAIEEAMNNQFGDSLSNMNVAPGASIPFTIVFRNLPEEIANINVEVVDSKPGAG